MSGRVLVDVAEWVWWTLILVFVALPLCVVALLGWGLMVGFERIIMFGDKDYFDKEGVK